MKEGIHKKLLSPVTKSESDLLIQKMAAQTLLQIYTLEPSTEIVRAPDLGLSVLIPVCRLVVMRL